MGFESSQVARRRLAALASSNGRVQAALSPSTFPGFCHAACTVNTGSDHDMASAVTAPIGAGHGSALIRHLDELAQDIVATPGAGGALLAAYAAQARALSMVVEAAARAGSAPLPASVLMAAQQALATPSPLAGVVVG